MGTSKKRPDVYPLEGVIVLHDCGHVLWKRTSPPPPKDRPAELKVSMTATPAECPACHKARTGLILPR